MQPGAPNDPVVDSGVGVPNGLTLLWAPYRMRYITEDASSRTKPSAEADKRPDPFLAVQELSDAQGLIIARGEHVFCLLNLYPYNTGHMMVIPKRQVAELEDLTDAESAELMQFAQAAIRAVKHASHPDAINAGFNLGKASGGSIGEHLHMHIVPRWQGDSSFMTVIDGTKVLPQVLRDTREILASAWIATGGPGVAHAER